MDIIMSVATSNILKLLSELSSGADQIVEENASEFKLPRLSEWVTLVENKAESIAEGTAGGESGEIPSVLSYLRGSTSKRGGRPRVSTVLTEIQRRHLHRKTLSKRQSVKTPLRRKSNVKVSAAYTENVQNEADFRQNVIFSSTSSSSTSSIQSKTPIATFTPRVLNKKGTTLKLNKKRSSKRKSSSGLENTKKKSKIGTTLTGDHPEENPMYNIEKKTKAKNSPLLPNSANMKSSATNVSNMKEIRTLRSKIESKEDKALENRKNIMALRKQKIEENKKVREEKIEKALQQRLKLEKQKLNKLGGYEKSTTTPNAIHKTVTGNETLGESKQIDKEGTSVKKLHLNLIKVGTSGSSKSSEKTPNKKNKKKEAEKVLNTTYVFSGKTPLAKEKEPPTISKGAVNDLSKTQKGIKGLKAIGSEKKLVVRDSANTSTPLQKKAPESYAITPARSSIVSYDISEIRSDSEEEEQEGNSKPIPSWATGVRLRNALLQQHHHPIDTDELFGNFFNPINLSVIMGVNKKQYNKRTSSAVWNSSFSFS